MKPKNYNKSDANTKRTSILTGINIRFLKPQSEWHFKLYDLPNIRFQNAHAYSGYHFTISFQFKNTNSNLYLIKLSISI